MSTQKQWATPPKEVTERLQSKSQNATSIEFTEEEKKLIREDNPKLDENDLKKFIYHCESSGLNPLTKQIYAQGFLDKKTGKFRMSIITSIDGYRAIADRTGSYAGSDDGVFAGIEKTDSFKSTVTVYKMVQGQRCPFTATARWAEYCPPGNPHMWLKMPHTMLSKCAEALALRKAFPAQLGGLYTDNEMKQAESEEQNERIDDAPHKTIDAEQRKDLFSIAKLAGFQVEDLKEYLSKNWGYDRTADILDSDFHNICEDLKVLSEARKEA